MESFTIDVPQQQLDDLPRAARAGAVAGHARGSGLGLRDRRAVPRAESSITGPTATTGGASEAELNDVGSFVTDAAGQRLHFLHRPSDAADAIPLVLTHGWPGSIVEFLDALPALRERFHVVVPSMPGYGFSGPTRERGIDVHRVADAVAALMAELGYERYVAQGGDWGALVTRRLGEAYGTHAVAIHCNMLFAMPEPGDPDAMAGVTEADLARFAAAANADQRRHRLHGDPVDSPQHVGVRLGGLARRFGRLDPREVPRLVRHA